MLDKLQERVCGAGVSSLPTSLKSLAHRRNVANLSLFFRYFFGRCSSELAQLVSLPYSHGKLARYSNGLHNFPPPFLDVISIPMSTVYFLAQRDSEILCLKNAFL